MRFMFLVEQYKSVDDGLSDVRVHVSVYESPIAALDKAKSLAGIGWSASWPHASNVIAGFHDSNDGRITITALAIE